ncbi:MAG: hypothetical protein DRQ51_08685 [Gammaproteobacteria bacterium]|nr:MAG: hypothetical protein DRQ51_08685 [Gammaproteobacteria bacterium]
MAKIIESVEYETKYNLSLCFQLVEYPDNISNKTERGYRFEWKNSNGKPINYNAGIIIPNAKILLDLLSKASKEGWFVSIEKNNTQEKIS